ncbi:MAG: GlxA family transcriptional regulator, partial [Achromobacter sp.]|nr:GlxA family transcriptional regulator [Achromobacter sp.]
MPHRVCILPVPNFQLLDMAGPLSVFQIAAELVPGAYEVAVVSAEGGLVRCSAGVPVQTRSWRGLRADTVLVPGGQ